VVDWLRAEPLQPGLRQLDRPRLTELARLLPELLSEVCDLARPEPLPESDLRQRLLDAAVRAILAARAPLLLLADDLPFWDRESLQLLHYLLRVEPEAPLLVAATVRSDAIDREHPLDDLRPGVQAWGSFTEIDLGRLSREETTILAERTVGHPLAASDADALYRETEGSPLFVVEALRAGWESRPAGRGWMSPKVQAVIEPRLAQLSEPARDLVGVTATIGRTFTTDVLAWAGEADEEALVRGLDELWRRRVVREQGADAYDFSHDKIREVAYLGLSPARRRRLHLRVARTLERVHAHDPGAVSGQIAGRYELAGVAGEAVTRYRRAAEEAQRLHAGVEAIRLLDRALDLLRALPTTPGRDARELGILTAFPGPLAGIEAYASGRVTQIQRRALDLTRKLGIEPAPPLLRSFARASLSRGDVVLRVEAAYVRAIAAFWDGELDAARRHFEAVVERYRPEQRRTHLLR
jgi:predicted ATPase